MKRVCFLLKLKKNRIDDYLKNHQVWPEMLQALSLAGIRNYSLFVREEDGLVVGYLEAEDPDAAFETIAKSEVSRRWEAFMDEFFEPDPQNKEIRFKQWLKQYFYLH